MYERPDDLVPTPQPLPAGPAWERLLLENPLPLVAVLIAGAVIVFYIMRRRARPGLGSAVAAGLVLLAGGLWLLARQVTTAREEVRAAAAELVDAAAKVDIARLERLLDDGAMAYTSQNPAGMPKGRILAQVTQELGEHFQVKEHDIQESQAVIDGPGVARAQLRVYVVEADGMSMSTWWALDLKREGSGPWRTTAIWPLYPALAAPRGR